MNQNVIRASVESVMPIARASGLFVPRRTIQDPPTTFGATGFPTGSYTDVAGLVDIPCTSAPAGLGSNISATERKGEPEILSTNMGHVLLDNWYPTIKPQTAPGSGQRAVIDGVAFDILGAESDSQSQMTRLSVRLASI